MKKTVRIDIGRRKRTVEEKQLLAAVNEELRKEIAERKRTEEALQSSERNLAAIINTIPTTAWTTRPDGYCDFLNRVWLDYAGMTAEQA